MPLRDWHRGQLGLLWGAWLLLLPVLWFTAPNERETIYASDFKRPARYDEQARADLYSREGATTCTPRGEFIECTVPTQEQIDSLAEVLARRDGWSPNPTIGDYFHSFYDQQFVILLWGVLGIPLFISTWRWFDKQKQR